MKTIRAVYENGVLRPLDPLDLDAGAKIVVDIHEPSDEDGGAISAISNASFAAIWDNPDDAIYDKYLAR